MRGKSRALLVIGSDMAESNPIRILIADDDPLVRNALSTMLSQHHEMKVEGEASNGQETMERARELRPDLLLLDLSMPKKAGMEALREMGDSIPNMHTVVVTVAIQKRQIVEALQLGAKGIVMKEAARDVLPAAIKTVLKGKYWVDRREVEDVRQLIKELSSEAEPASSKRDLLNSREQQILDYIVEGCTNREIARLMETSEQVVKNHLGKIFDKLGVFNRLELALYALDNRMVERK